MVMPKGISEKIRRFFKDQNNIAAVYVFGSYAKGDVKKWSDVDLAILFLRGKTVAWEQSLEMREAIAALLTKEIDLIVMNAADPIVKHQIYKYGKAILVNDRAFVNDFFVQSLMEYLDVKITRAIIEKKILNRRVYD